MIGKIIGNDGVQIRIDTVDDYITATVISVNAFWAGRVSMLYRDSNGVAHMSTAFEPGMVLKFDPTDCIILEPKHLLWFVLDLENERFEHYR